MTGQRFYMEFGKLQHGLRLSTDPVNGDYILKLREASPASMSHSAAVVRLNPAELQALVKHFNEVTAADQLS